MAQLTKEQAEEKLDIEKELKCLAEIFDVLIPFDKDQQEFILRSVLWKLQYEAHKSNRKDQPCPTPTSGSTS